MLLTSYTTFILIITVIIANLALIVFMGSKSFSAQLCALSIVSLAAWVAAVGIFMALQNPHWALFNARLAYYIGILTSILFFLFFMTFPGNQKIDKVWISTIIGLQLAYAYIFLCTDAIIQGIYEIPSPSHWGWSFGSFSWIFEITFFGFFGAGITLLIKKNKNTPDRAVRKNIEFITWSAIVGLAPAALFSIILPRFGIYDTNWLGPASEIVWIPLLIYSIVKYKQMNIRIVIAEALGAAMVALFFMHAFAELASGLWIRMLSFSVFIALTFYLIKVSLRELYKKEQVLRELEKFNETKNQFVMLARHNLQSSMANISSEISKAHAGTYGDLDAGGLRFMEKIGLSVQNATRVINNLLSSATLKSNFHILTLSEQSMLPLLEETLREFYLDIEAMNLSLEYSKDAKDWPIIQADHQKMREVLVVLMENAIRYNKRNGYIRITTSVSDNFFVIIIENSGIGIEKEDQENLFNNLSYRGRQARSIHPRGMGVGLKISKNIIQAHHGDLSIHSEGENKGATVTLTLPLQHLLDTPIRKSSRL